MQITNKQLILALTISLALSIPLNVQANSGGHSTTISGPAYVGDSTTGSVVSIDTGFMGEVYGGYEADANPVFDNTVNVSSDVTQTIFGGHSQNGAAYNNQVNITAGKLGLFVYGGDGGTDAYNNTVTLTGGTVSYIFAGRGSLGAAYDNTVNISGGQVNYVEGGNSSRDSAYNNTINISGGTVVYKLSGGNIDNNSKSTTVSATNNTINIGGNPTFGSTELYGGTIASWNDMGNDLRSGNTLRIMTSGLQVKKVANFQYYEFVLGSYNVDRTPMIAVSGDALLGHVTQAGKISIPTVDTGAKLAIGQNITLLTAGGVLDLNNIQLDAGLAKQGILTVYGYELVQNGNAIEAIITSKSPNEQTKSVADGQLAAMGMLISGADLIAETAMANAAQGSNQYDTFAALNYGRHSMNSISSIDVQGSSMLVGMSRNLHYSNSYTTLGAFLEAGWGTYDSALGEVSAKGHTNYYGLGMLARHNRADGLYTEGSIRAGKVGNTYSGDKVDDGTYDASSTYYGLHLGIGKIHKLNDHTSLDYYAKYFWTHETATNANIMGDEFHFKAIDSQRVRVGARLNNTNKNVTHYVGLAYEYEFSGSAAALAYNIDVASPTVKGSTGILELGAKYKPNTESRFSMDVGLNGYVGKRQGVSGNVKLNWAF